MVIVSVLYFVDYKAPTTSADATATMTTKSLKFIPSKQSKDDKISIPAVGSITLKEGRNNQKVNLFNPKSNNCYFNISIKWRCNEWYSFGWFNRGNVNC